MERIVEGKFKFKTVLNGYPCKDYQIYAPGSIYINGEKQITPSEFWELILAGRIYSRWCNYKISKGTLVSPEMYLIVEKIDFKIAKKLSIKFETETKEQSLMEKFKNEIINSWKEIK